MKNIRFPRYASLLVILPLSCLLSCGGSGDTSMNNRANQNNQSNTSSTSQEETFPDEQTAAKKGLETFAKLVDAENFKDMGFESAEEVKTATLGAPIKVFLVRLDQLREFKQGADPKTLLTDVNRSIYPVMAGDQARSSITVEGENGKWKAVSFGDAGVTKKIVEISAKRPPLVITRKILPPIRKIEGGEDKRPIAPTLNAMPPILVHVAFLNLYFVGQTANGRLTLTNATTVPNSRFAETIAMPADQAFALLVPLAMAYNGLPM